MESEETKLTFCRRRRRQWVIAFRERAASRVIRVFSRSLSLSALGATFFSVEHFSAPNTRLGGRKEGARVSERVCDDPSADVDWFFRWFSRFIVIGRAPSDGSMIRQSRVSFLFRRNILCVETCDQSANDKFFLFLPDENSGPGAAGGKQRPCGC